MSSLNSFKTMRRPLIAGNWKMNLNRSQAVQLATELAAQSAVEGCDVLVCPTTAYLDAVGVQVKPSQVSLGAQDVYFESNGAYTGETSVEMITDLGCEYVILGHSERRNVIGETDELINQKVKAALTGNITPIVCVGELLAEREAGKTLDVVRSQFEGSLAGVTSEEMAKVVLAYEPVWAIGTGKTATPDQAQEVHASLRRLIAERFSGDVADGVRILYGGSVKPANAAELMSQLDIDGALVGGASLKSDSFGEIIRAAQAVVSQA